MSRKKCVGIPRFFFLTEKFWGNFSVTKIFVEISVRQIFLVKLQQKFQFTILTEIFLVKLQLKFFLTKRKLIENCSKLNKNVTFTTHFSFAFLQHIFFLTVLTKISLTKVVREKVVVNCQELFLLTKIFCKRKSSSQCQEKFSLTFRQHIFSLTLWWGGVNENPMMNNDMRHQND